jgi:hypothetical protein
MQRTVILATHLRDRLYEAGYEVIEASPEDWQLTRAAKRWAIRHPKSMVFVIISAMAVLIWAIVTMLAPTVVQADTVAQFFARNSMAVADREFVDEEVRVRGTATIVDATDFHYVVDWPIAADALSEVESAKIGNIEIEPTSGMPEQALPRGTAIDFEGTAIKFRDHWGLLINDAEVSRTADR